MGKTLTCEQRKNNKYIDRDNARANKNREYTPRTEKKEKPRQKWRPHSETDYD